MTSFFFSGTKFRTALSKVNKIRYIERFKSFFAALHLQNTEDFQFFSGCQSAKHMRNDGLVFREKSMKSH